MIYLKLIKEDGIKWWEIDDDSGYFPPSTDYPILDEKQLIELRNAINEVLK